jgi:hypothetical protein
MGECQLSYSVKFSLFVPLLSYFTIVGSNLIKHQGVYQVAVTSQGYEHPPVFEVAIRSTKRDASFFESKQNVTLEDGYTQLVELNVSKSCGVVIFPLNLTIHSLRTSH